MNEEQQTTRLTAALRVQDERGLHCRVSALLAYSLRTEAPRAAVTLRTPEGREADPKMPYQTMNIGARHSRIVKFEATGPDAERALEVARGIVEREPLRREEVVEAIPAGVGGDVGKIRARQQEFVRLEQEAVRRAPWAHFREEDKRDLEEWKSPGGWLHELASVDDLAPWVKRAMEEFGIDDPGRIGTDADGRRRAPGRHRRTPTRGGQPQERRGAGPREAGSGQPRAGSIQPDRDVAPPGSRSRGDTGRPQGRE